MTRILGVDPGISGALALIDTDIWACAILDMPLEAGTKGKSKVSAMGLLNAVRAADCEHAFLEEVHSSPQQGVTSAFSFGDGYGCARTACLAADLSTWTVRPQVWKQAMRAPKDKKQATTRAAQLVPAAHSMLYGPRGGALDGRAEALLLAFYGVLNLKFQPARALRLMEFPVA